MKAMKFKVDSETESRLLQNVLFARGYQWFADNKLAKEPRHTKSTYLFTSSDGYITQASHQGTFDSSKCEYWGTMAYIYNSHNPSSDSPNKQIVLVEVLGKMYNKGELEAALSSLTQYHVEK